MTHELKIEIALIVAWLLFIAAWGCWLSERNAFNRGVCRICGTLWRRFDTDSQGGRGYMCGHGHDTWCSWPGTDKEAR